MLVKVFVYDQNIIAWMLEEPAHKTADVILD